MKVLEINVVCGIGSTGRICTDIAEILSTEGHECKIAYGRDLVPEKYKKYSIKIETDFGVNLHAINARIFDSAGFGSRKSTQKFIKWIDEYNPDVIHIHNIHGYYLNIEILFDYFKLSNKPVIWTLHDCWAFTGHSAYCGECHKWMTGCDKCVNKLGYPRSYFSDAKKNWEKKKNVFCNVPNLVIVTPSDWLAKLVEKSFLNKYMIKVIKNGIDVKQFQKCESNIRNKYDLGDKRILLGVASTWEERKGLRDFIQLSDKLDDDYKIILVGISKKQEKILPNRILPIKRTNSIVELAELYSIAEVYLNFTYEDNYPTTNLEALACGTPVITYKTGGSIESAASSCIVEQGDLNKVAQIIKNKEYEFKEDLVLDKEHLLRNYLDLYQKVVKNNED